MHCDGCCWANTSRSERFLTPLLRSSGTFIICLTLWNLAGRKRSAQKSTSFFFWEFLFRYCDNRSDWKLTIYSLLEELLKEKILAAHQNRSWLQIFWREGFAHHQRSCEKRYGTGSAWKLPEQMERQVWERRASPSFSSYHLVVFPAWKTRRILQAISSPIPSPHYSLLRPTGDLESSSPGISDRLQALWPDTRSYPFLEHLAYSVGQKTPNHLQSSPKLLTLLTLGSLVHWLLPEERALQSGTYHLSWPSAQLAGHP